MALSDTTTAAKSQATGFSRVLADGKVLYLLAQSTTGTGSYGVDLVALSPASHFEVVHETRFVRESNPNGIIVPVKTNSTIIGGKLAVRCVTPVLLLRLAWTLCSLSISGVHNHTQLDKEDGCSGERRRVDSCSRAPCNTQFHD